VTIGRFSHRRDEPFFWWGVRDRPSPSLDLPSLISSGFVTEDEADALLGFVNAGLSLFVISEARGAGKSTFLAALIDAADGSRARMYLRGNYETFDFLHSSHTRDVMLLVNEISPHLPAYLWGPPVAALFEAMDADYQALGTAHAESTAAFVHMLTTAPLRLPVSLATQPMIVVRLVSPDASDSIPRGLAGIDGIRPVESPGAFVIENIADSSHILDRSILLHWHSFGHPDWNH